MRNLFTVLAGDSFIGKSASVLVAPAKLNSTVQKAAQDGLTFTDDNAHGKLFKAMKSLNESGFIGTIGFGINTIRAVYDTMNLEYTIQHGKATPAQIISLAGRYVGVYSGIGNFYLFLKTISPVAREALLVAGRALRLDEVFPSVWGPRGILALDTEPRRV